VPVTVSVIDPMDQPDLFSRPRAAPDPRPPNPEFVRKHLRRVLNKVREAERMPWNEPDTEHWIEVFPQLARALPAEEATAITGEFAAEIERLRAA
jgi:uncharacterized protein (DUF2267 family)